MFSFNGMRLNNFCDVKISEDYLWNHTLKDDIALLSTIVGILNTGRVAMSLQEAVNISRMVTRTNHLAGEIAECGTFHGGSALIMAEANRAQKKIHLFDTFSGIPETTPGVDTVAVGDIRGASLEDVRSFLRKFEPIIEFHPGLFPDTTAGLSPNAQFCFVNIDFDVYQSTKAALEYFYPRMVRGGVLVSHDYSSQSCPGVKRAVDEFFGDKPETIIDLWHTQIAMVKM